MPYIACRDFKMPPPGSRAGIVEVRAGDVVDAESWTNVDIWVEAGYIRFDLKADTPPKAPVPSPPSASGGLRAALADPDSHSRRKLLELAEKAGVELPERLPRSKAATIQALAEIIGVEV